MKQQQCNTSVMLRQGGTQIYCSENALTTQADTYKQIHTNRTCPCTNRQAHTQYVYADRQTDTHSIKFIENTPLLALRMHIDRK